MLNRGKILASLFALSVIFSGCGKDNNENIEESPISDKTIEESLEKESDDKSMIDNKISDTVSNEDNNKSKDLNVVEWENFGEVWQTDDFKLELQDIKESKVSDEEIEGVGISKKEYPYLYSVDYAYLVNENLGDDYFIDPIKVTDNKGNEGFMLFVDQSLDVTGSGVSQKHTTITVGFKEEPETVKVFFDENGEEKDMSVKVK